MTPPFTREVVVQFDQTKKGARASIRRDFLRIGMRLIIPDLKVVVSNASTKSMFFFLLHLRFSTSRADA